MRHGKEAIKSLKDCLNFAADFMPKMYLMCPKNTGGKSSRLAEQTKHMWSNWGASRIMPVDEIFTIADAQGQPPADRRHLGTLPAQWQLVKLALQ
jgi:hypothetical protein